MNAIRRLTRDWRFCLLVAYAFVLAGLAGTRMAAQHAGGQQALAALSVMCSGLGLDVPAESHHDHGKGHPECPCGPFCPFKSFGSIPQASTKLAWNASANSAALRIALDAAPPFARIAPSVSARGPPILI